MCSLQEKYHLKIKVKNVAQQIHYNIYIKRRRGMIRI